MLRLTGFNRDRIGHPVVLLCMLSIAVGVRAEAASLTSVSSIPPRRSDWSEALVVDRFDPGLGGLQSAELVLTGRLISDGSAIENLGRSAATFTLDVAATISLQWPDTMPLLQATPAVSREVDLGPFDGREDFGGSSGITFQDLADAAVTSVTTNDPGDLSALTGPGSIAMPVRATVSAVFTGSANVIPLAWSMAGAQLEVTYHFTGPGDQEELPLMPTGTTGPPWVFDGVTGDGAWFDPVPAAAYVYATDGRSSFLELQLPAMLGDADGYYTVRDPVNGDARVPEGGRYLFASPVSRFSIGGIDPAVDGSDPGAFPTYLRFDQQVVSFAMAPLPEPLSGMLASLAAVVLGCYVTRRDGCMPDRQR